MKELNDFIVIHPIQFALNFLFFMHFFFHMLDELKK